MIIILNKLTTVKREVLMLDKIREWLEKKQRENDLLQAWIDSGCNVENRKPVFTK
jgi:hypothetical protein